MCAKPTGTLLRPCMLLWNQLPFTHIELTAHNTPFSNTSCNNQYTRYGIEHNIPHLKYQNLL